MAELKVVTDEQSEQSRWERIGEGLAKARVSAAKAEVKTGRGVAVVAVFTHTTEHFDRIAQGYADKRNEQKATGCKVLTIEV